MIHTASSTQPTDLSKRLAAFRGLWVTLTKSDEVISADKNAEQAYKKAQQKGYEEPILFKVPLHDLPHSG